MAGRAVRFTVLGTPVPQGSKSAFIVKGRAVIAESNRAKLKPWRSMVAAEADAAMAGAELFAGPVQLDLRLVFPRPKAHYRTGKHAGELREDAPQLVATRPDASKVLRAIEDALTGIVYRDDAQVATLTVEKHYGDRPEAIVTVRELARPTDA